MVQLPFVTRCHKGHNKGIMGALPKWWIKPFSKDTKKQHHIFRKSNWIKFKLFHSVLLNEFAELVMVAEPITS